MATAAVSCPVPSQTVVVEEPRSSLLLYLPANGREQYTSFMDRLNQILQKYKTSGDYLSLQLLKWGFKTLGAYSPEDFESEEPLLQAAQQRIDKLAQKILIDPYDQTPLRVEEADKPLLEGDWVWQASTLAKYRRVCTTNYDGRPFSEVPYIHEFACEMICWLASLPVRSPNDDASVVAPATQLRELFGNLHLGAQQTERRPQTPLELFVQWESATATVKKAVQIRQAKERRKKWKILDAQEHAQQKDYLLAISQRIIDRLRQQMAENQQRLEEQLREARQRQQQELAPLSAQLEALEQELCSLQKQHASLNSQLQQLQQQASSDHRALATLSRELQQLTAKVKKKKKKQCSIM